MWREKEVQPAAEPPEGRKDKKEGWLVVKGWRKVKASRFLLLLRLKSAEGETHVQNGCINV
jgi:hypothetical protein